MQENQPLVRAGGDIAGVMVGPNEIFQKSHEHVNGELAAPVLLQAGSQRSPLLKGMYWARDSGGQGIAVVSSCQRLAHEMAATVSASDR